MDMKSLDSVIDILKNDKVRELLDETARWYYSDDFTTVNLIPAFLITGLLLFLLGPIIALVPRLLDTIAALFDKPLESSGYGAPASSYGAPEPSYGAPAPAYGAPSYSARSFSDEGRELASLVSGFLGKAEGGLAPEFSIDSLTTALKTAQKLLQ